MRMSPRPSRSAALPVVLATLLSALLVGGTLAPAAAAPGATSRTITARSSTGAALAKALVTVSGTVSRSPKGSTVIVQRRSGSSWVKVLSTRTTTSRGAYSTRFRLPAKSATYSFRAVAPAKGSLRAATSPVVKVAALTRVKIDMDPLPSTVRAGQNTTFFGSVLPYVAGTTISIQRQSGARWTSVATVKLDGTGSFNRAVRVLSTGSYRAYVPRVGLKAPAYSQARTVKATPVIATTSLVNGAVGRTYSAQLTTVGGATGTWTANPLPAGITLNATTGRLSGRPTAQGTTSIQVGFTQAGTGYSAPAKRLPLKVTQPAKPVIVTTSLPAVNLGDPYVTTLKAEGDALGTWTASPLPAGTHLDGATGQITGTPSGPVGTTQVTLGFTESGTGEHAVSKTLPLKVNAAVDPVIETSSLPVGGVTRAYTATLAVTTKPAPPGTWTATPLPDGLSLDQDTGVISGTPTTGGTTQVTIGFTQTSTGKVAAAKTLALKVNALPVISTTSLPPAAVGRAYTTTLAATGNPAGTWTASPLPTGFTLDAATGTISGNPATTSSTQVTIGFTETATGLPAVPKTLTLGVFNAPVITTTALPDGGVGKQYTPTTLTAAGSPTGTWTASPLPAGLQLDAATGVITGTPTTGGTTQVVIGFTETSTGVAATPKTIALKVNPLPVIATTSLPNGKTSQAYNQTLTTVGNLTGTWASQDLPSWLTLNPATGALTGTGPAVLLIPGYQDFTFTVRFTQTSTGLTSAPKQLTIRVTLF